MEEAANRGLNIQLSRSPIEEYDVYSCYYFYYFY